MKRWLRYGSLLIAVLFASVTVEPAFSYADAPYHGYTENTHGDRVHSINGYFYERSIEGVELESGPLNAPEDIFVGSDDSLYIVDTGNSRILHLTEDGKLIKVMGAEEGKGKLNEPKGVFVTGDGTVYAADTKNQRIVIYSADGTYQKEFAKPESPLLGASFSYSPSKLLVDKRGYMFVVSDGNTQGLIQIDPNGQFRGFYGANHIGFSWSRLFVRMLATDEQKAKLATTKPLEFSNAVQDKEGFIYTTTLGTETNQVKRLSPVGVDTLNPGVKVYGDQSFDSIPAFIDITVDENGVMTALDLMNSKVYQYDKLGTLLFVFGGLGEQNGLFVTPSSIAQSSKGTIYVVDKGRNRVDLFRTTPFADTVHEASKLYVDGRYEEAEGLWQQVLQQNGNFDLAYFAIGKSLYKAQRYQEAMSYFKLAGARGEYSDAFYEYRKEWIREYFAWISGGIIVLFLFLRYLLPRMMRKMLRGFRAYSKKEKHPLPQPHSDRTMKGGQAK
ncbi:hypothetical protein J45TS6_18050 [Paenibacillus sp. J45TS6]|uniref:hypothetical protein n=1 Tax=Paenibacillus sp. J45TS6 TaxID=2807196 RepID=UPI001B154C43|nr:hypothetical protein [Paenibacillus sp. J45TS6]GIP43346.1 hypothetical protein J45TS6_18050 [Paenibacillus sp. J45TS6]